jgi:hypothetical protein
MQYLIEVISEPLRATAETRESPSLVDRVRARKEAFAELTDAGKVRSVFGATAGPIRHWLVLDVESPLELSELILRHRRKIFEYQILSTLPGEIYCSGRKKDVGSLRAHCKKVGEQISALQQKKRAGTITDSEMGELNSLLELWEISGCDAFGVVAGPDSDEYLA